MCGICGVAGGDRDAEAPRVEAMTRALSHRGPDDQGVVVTDGAVLGNRRLAILDPTPAGHQPIGSRDGRFWITFNGEIYNFRDLRRELEGGGHEFESHSDTEVLLTLYVRHGRSLLDRVNGMFAFAVWDSWERQLFAARDHFGQKPFYWAAHGGRLFFASEIKALLAHGALPVDVEPVGVDDYLALRAVCPPATLFRGINKLPAGHSLEWSPGSEPVVKAFWRPRFDSRAERSDADWVEGLRERIAAAVSAHSVSDVPVGAFLSGGLDSSVVVAALSRAQGPGFRTFAIGSEDPRFDERPHARTVANHLGTLHRDAAVSDDVLRTIPRIVSALDEPSDPIAACFFEASRLAATEVKVVMGGDGGDEMFGGFDRYAVFGLVNAYARLPAWLREGVVHQIVRRVPESFGYKSVAQKLHWLDSVASAKDARLYARMSSHTRFGPEFRDSLYGDELRRSLAGRDPLESIVRPFEALVDASPLDRMIHADLMTRLPEHTLMLADRLSMAHGLEVRSPLLDVDLAEYCVSMPARLRVRHGRTKVGLRRAAEPWLPASILARPKQGFMFPVARWMQSNRLHALSERLIGGPMVREGWVRPPAIRTLFENHARGFRDNHVRIWQLLSLDAWHRIYLGGRDPMELEEEMNALVNNDLSFAQNTGPENSR